MSDRSIGIDGAACRSLRYSRGLFRYGRALAARVRRADGAKVWSTELAQVRVAVGWERPMWRVSWRGDGQVTQEA